MEYVNIFSKSQISDRQNSFIYQVQNVSEISFSEDNCYWGKKSCLKLVYLGTSLVVQRLNHPWWLRLHTPNIRGTGSIAGQETKIIYVPHSTAKKKKNPLYTEMKISYKNRGKNLDVYFILYLKSLGYNCNYVLIPFYNWLFLECSWNLLLVSAVRQSESVIHIHAC